MASQPAFADDDAFERLTKELAAVWGRCSTEQLLELADDLHALIRRRRHPPQPGAPEEARSFDP